MRIYYPTGSSELEKFPLIVFSTGLGRSRDDCAYLGRHWASCGYVSVHVQHKGSDEEVRQGNLRPRKELQRAFYAPQNIRNRPIDIIFVIDRLEAMQRKGSTPGDRCDLTRIGVAGHDFGAQTVLALAGEVLPGQLAFSEPRVKAVVAMSSPVPLGQVPLDLAFGNISRPCLHITGTADNSIVGTTKASQRRLPFDYTVRRRSIPGHVLRRRSHDLLGPPPRGQRHARCHVSTADRRMLRRLLGRLFEGRRRREGLADRRRVAGPLGAAGWVRKKPASDRPAGK